MTDPTKILPNLRFPEFKNDGEWKVVKLGDVFKRITDKNKENNNNVLTISAQNGLVSQYDYFNKNVAANDVTGYYLIKTGDFAYNKSRSQGYPYGAIKPLKLYDKGVVSTLYICFRTKEQNSCIDFYEHYFETDLIHNEIGKIAQEGARNHGLLNISTEDFFEKISLYIPSLPEQQKIAAFLTSLDEQISAHTKKLEALKAHKKGLMQQFFPVNGEKTPKLRFPEFENNGEWKIQTLGNCLLQAPDYGLNARAVPYSPVLPTYLRITDIDDNGCFISNKKTSVDAEITDENLLKAGDIVFARTGASVGKVYKYRAEDGALIFAGFLIRVRPDNSKYCSDYIFQYLFTEEYKRWINITSSRSGQPGINSNEYASLPIPFPSLPEQQKIASFLSSIDDMIQAQDDKIRNLKIYKNGLMQQMFPHNK